MPVTTAFAAGVSRISPMGVVAVLSGGAAMATPAAPISKAAARAVRMGRMVGLFSRVVGLMMRRPRVKAILNRTLVVNFIPKPLGFRRPVRRVAVPNLGDG
jgi:hypothetical protein